MSGFSLRFAFIVCQLMLLTGRISGNFWLSASVYPKNPNDRYYQAFQTVPPPSVTANKLMANFLQIQPGNQQMVTRGKRTTEIHDIVVVMDGSGSVRACEFEKGKKALHYMFGITDEYHKNVDPKYAAVTFASSARVNFKFLPYSSAASKILKIPYPNGMTNTQAGLAEAKKLFDDPTSGRRPSPTRKMVFLVTDGQSNVHRHLTIPKANALKNSGVDIYVVAVGTYISGIDEMVKAASYPPNLFLFRVKKLSGFWKIIKLILKQVSPGKWRIANGQYDPPC